MNLQADIDYITSEIQKVKDPELISAFKNLLKYRSKNIAYDWWDEISEEEKAEIEESVREIEEGKFLSHDEVMKNARQWL